MKWTLLVLSLFTSLALAALRGVSDAQDGKPESDPVLDSVQMAFKERHFSDAEKILVEAIQRSDQNDPINPHLADYRDRLVWAVYEQGRTADAEKIARDAVAKAEKANPQCPQLASALESLASLLTGKGQLTEALDLLRRALSINQNALGPDDRSVVQNLVAIADILGNRGDKKEQEETLKQALDIVNSNPRLGSDERRIVLQFLSQLYIRERRFSDAEVLLSDGLQDCAEDRNTNFCMGFSESLSMVYRSEGQIEEARSLDASVAGWPLEAAILARDAQEKMEDHEYPSAEDAIRRLLAWIEQHPGYETRRSWQLESLAGVLEQEGRTDEAEETYRELIKNDLYWVVHSRGTAESRWRDSDFEMVSIDLGLFLDFCRDAHRVRDAEPIAQHALSEEEDIAGPDSPGIASTLVVLATIYQAEGADDKAMYGHALSLYERALNIGEATLGPDDPRLEDVLNPYLDLLKEMHQDAKAAAMQARIEALDRQDERNTAAAH